MTALATPVVHWYDSWQATLADFGDEFPHGSCTGPEDEFEGRDACERFVADRRWHADLGASCPGAVPRTCPFPEISAAVDPWGRHSRDAR